MSPTYKFQQTRHVVEHALTYVKGSTLDLGAGTAKYRSMIQEHASSYTTFDVMPGEHIDVVGDLVHTGFADGQFDTVFSTQVFEHVPFPWRAAHELYRITRHGGTVIVTAPFMVPYHADPHDYYRYTPDGLSALLTDAGFEIIEADYYTKLFTVLSEAIHHTIFSPYRKKRRGADRIMKLITRIAGRLDRWVRCEPIYGNVYVIARKKSL